MVAMQAHGKQVDKGGETYLGHISRVVSAMPPDDLAAKTVAYMHDSIEDGAHTLEGIGQMGFDEEILSALDAISRRPRELYEVYIVRLARNPLARRVKKADLADNMNLTRLNRPIQASDMHRLAKYARASAYLMGIEQDEERAAILADLAYNRMKSSGELERLEIERARLQELNWSDQ